MMQAAKPLITFFSSKPYDEQMFSTSPHTGFELNFLEARLTHQTVALAESAKAVCVFVNDKIDRRVVSRLRELGVNLLALRCAGYNNVDLQAAHETGVTIVRVPAYSPAAVAEHAVGLMLSLNRKYHKAYNRVRDGNFALHGLVGFDMKGKTVGIIGTGRIGLALIPILRGFGCRVLAYDLYQQKIVNELGAEYVELNTLLGESDIISLHCPLFPETRGLVNADRIAQMKRGVMIINTSRGGLVDTRALIAGLKSGQVGSVGLDVYEEEEALFFEDMSQSVIQDDVFVRLLSFPNVLITGHQGFLTNEALCNIAHTTLENVRLELAGQDCGNRVLLPSQTPSSPSVTR